MNFHQRFFLRFQPCEKSAIILRLFCVVFALLDVRSFPPAWKLRFCRDLIVCLTQLSNETNILIIEASRRLSSLYCRVGLKNIYWKVLKCEIPNSGLISPSVYWRSICHTQVAVIQCVYYELASGSNMTLPASILLSKLINSCQLWFSTC